MRLIHYSPGRLDNSDNPGLRRQGRERGMALIAVLWITAALTVLVAGIAGSARVDADIASAMYDRARIGALLDGALRVAARDLVLGAQQQDAQREAGRLVFHYRINGQMIHVEAAGGGGFISLNTATEPLLSLMFMQAAHLPESQAQLLAQHVVQWRAPAAGQENSEAVVARYRDAGLSYGPRFGPFLRPDDLQQVLGVTLPVYNALRPLVSARMPGAGAGVDVMESPPEVLAVLANGDQGLVRRIMQAVAAGDSSAQNMDGLDSQFVSPGGGGMDYRLRASMTSDFGKRWQRDAWVAAGGGLGTRREQKFPWEWYYADPVVIATGQ